MENKLKYERQIPRVPPGDRETLNEGGTKETLDGQMDRLDASVKDLKYHLTMSGFMLRVISFSIGFIIGIIVSHLIGK